MFGLQSHFIFPRHAVGPAGTMPKGTSKLSLKTPDGETLYGVHIPPAAPKRSDLLLIGFAGNAWNSADAAAFLHEIFPDAHVIQFHYRGYHPSTGEPSADVLRSDSELIYDFAADKVPARQIVAVGFSIGSGVAAHLATKRELDGLILVTPFDSLKAVAADHFPWLPIGPLFAHEMDSAEAISKSDTPVAIIAGDRDDLVRPERTELLRHRVRNLSYYRTIVGAGHNDIYRHGEFRQAMREALAALSR